MFKKIRIGLPLRAILAIGLIVLSVLSGVFLFILGIKETVSTHRQAQNYQTVTGYLYSYMPETGSEPHSAHRQRNATSYYLVYRYTVNGQDYTVATDYSTGALPEVGSQKQIRYDPSDPQNALIVGPDRGGILLFAGAMFAGIPLALALAVFIVLKSKKEKSSIDVVGATFGLLFVLFSYGMMYMASGTYTPLGIWRFYTRSFSPMLLILPLLTAAGLFVLVKSLFFAAPRRGRSKKRAARR
ncbi:Protein of uncharacterised function (DUF3592) [Anaerotruncus sp. 2789STDY5834896]|uniref:Protein of uncharacterized function (DUF3592) n=1 Tax=uncultured Anaerotruncus sp. TaxID=905011 RepID=A0A1C6HFK0_9FIRM|nr:Protein of uncharacterised function (DUF3592) [uncultured Anaerotruncus sp.]